MIFEGTEKKFELLLKPGKPSLRSLGREFWDEVVRAAEAVVLSTVANEHCDAYLLSESSLFVYDDRAVMITCGRTRLVGSVQRLLRRVPVEGVESFIYERKNENFPHLQPTTFEDDVAILKDLMPGVATRFGEQDGHHLSLFHLANEHHAPLDDITAEFLMYDLSPEVRARFTDPAHARIVDRSGVRGILPGYTLDEHFFEPSGYSMNGIDGDRYHTIHVTPNESGSYASFETNCRFTAGEMAEVLARAVRVFEPRRLDLILFQIATGGEAAIGDFRLVDREIRSLSCGYRVEFSHFVQTPVAGGRVS
jgi:S-adenosylmethionine decarboxylase